MRFLENDYFFSDMSNLEKRKVIDRFLSIIRNKLDLKEEIKKFNCIEKEIILNYVKGRNNERKFKNNNL